MSAEGERNFIRAQGFPEPAAETCHLQYSALLFQPRLVGLAVLLGIVLQEPWVFFALAALLWWSALLPRLNPFEAVYNAIASRRPGRVALAPAPPPRRFAQGMAGSFALAIGIASTSGSRTTAFVLEGLLLAAISALALGGFCLGSFVFHLLRGRAAFAMRTLPWGRGA